MPDDSPEKSSSVQGAFQQKPELQYCVCAESRRCGRSTAGGPQRFCKPRRSQSWYDLYTVSICAISLDWQKTAACNSLYPWYDAVSLSQNLHRISVISRKEFEEVLSQKAFPLSRPRQEDCEFGLCTAAHCRLEIGHVVSACYNSLKAMFCSNKQVHFGEAMSWYDQKRLLEMIQISRAAAFWAYACPFIKDYQVHRDFDEMDDGPRKFGMRCKNDVLSHNWVTTMAWSFIFKISVDAPKQESLLMPQSTHAHASALRCFTLHEKPLKPFQILCTYTH